MNDLVDPNQIELIVGARRHSVKHLGRVVTATQTTYILHSQLCLQRGEDLRECVFSRAMDEGFDLAEFEAFTDRPIVMAVDSQGVLCPAEIARIREDAPAYFTSGEAIIYLDADGSAL